MKKILLLALIMFASSCNFSCSGLASSGWSRQSDSDAQYSQDMMHYVVKVNLEAVARSGNQNESDISAGHVGSGVVVAYKVKKYYEIDVPESLVVTAAHVCNVEPLVKTDKGLYSVYKYRFTVTTIEGDNLPAKPIYMNSATDVCVLKVLGRAGDAVQLADDMPPVGSRILFVGAPTGTFGIHAAVAMDGRFGGIENFGVTDYSVMSIASVGGCSGGGVFYKGKVFSLLLMNHRGDGNLSWGVTLNNLKADLVAAYAKW